MITNHFYLAIAIFIIPIICIIIYSCYAFPLHLNIYNNIEYMTLQNNSLMGYIPILCICSFIVLTVDILYKIYIYEKKKNYLLIVHIACFILLLISIIFTIYYNINQEIKLKNLAHLITNKICKLQNMTNNTEYDLIYEQLYQLFCDFHNLNKTEDDIATIKYALQFIKEKIFKLNNNENIASLNMLYFHEKILILFLTMYIAMNLLHIIIYYASQEAKKKIIGRKKLQNYLLHRKNVTQS